MEDQDNVRTISIRDDVIGRHSQERCEGCGALFATPRFLNPTHDRIAPHPDVKAQHQSCPPAAGFFPTACRLRDAANKDRQRRFLFIS